MNALAAAKPGTSGTVAYLQAENEIVLNKFLAMGISPGISLTLEQRFPAYLIAVGETRVAFDREMAEKIFIVPID